MNSTDATGGACLNAFLISSIWSLAFLISSKNSFHAGLISPANVLHSLKVLSLPSVSSLSAVSTSNWFSLALAAHLSIILSSLAISAFFPWKSKKSTEPACWPRNAATTALFRSRKFTNILGSRFWKSSLYIWLREAIHVCTSVAIL